MAMHQDVQARGRITPRLPEQLPDDLRWHLLDTLGYDSCTPQDIWDTVRDWMISNGMARTGGSRIDPGPQGSMKVPEHGSS